MGFFSRLSVVIIEAYEQGIPIEEIARKLDLDYKEVVEIVNAYSESEEAS